MSPSPHALVLTGISSMATRAVLAELAAGFEAATGVKVVIESVGGVDAAKRMAAADDDGVVVVPAARAVDTWEAAQKRERFEGEKRAKFASGVLGLDMHNMRSGLKKAGVRYIG